MKTDRTSGNTERAPRLSDVGAKKEEEEEEEEKLVQQTLIAVEL